jgi:1-acyl-sn-glycerol-3-phosphate acyltransferase
MSTYVVFTKLRPDGRKRLTKNPQRLSEVRAEIEKLGAKVTQQFSVLGEYDFVTFLDAPGNAEIARVGAEIASLGTMRNMTLPALAVDRFQELLKMEPYRTEPHLWQTSWWASAVRRAGRYWTTSRYVRQYCKPLTIEGRENLDGFKGPAIIIGNHSSHFDSTTVFAALPGRIRNKLAMAAAADKFYASRKKRVWWPSLFQNAFPVHRGGGTKQLDYPKSLLKRGWSILIYPEGGRSKTGQFARFKAGPAIMAMQAHVPVIPIYMEGLRAIMPKGNRNATPGPAMARIGKPVSLEGVESVSEATAMLENAMRELAGLPPHRAAAPASAAPAEAPAMASAGGGSAGS